MPNWSELSNNHLSKEEFFTNLPHLVGKELYLVHAGRRITKIEVERTEISTSLNPYRIKMYYDRNDKKPIVFVTGSDYWTLPDFYRAYFQFKTVEVIPEKDMPSEKRPTSFVEVNTPKEPKYKTVRDVAPGCWFKPRHVKTIVVKTDETLGTGYRCFVPATGVLKCMSADTEVEVIYNNIKIDIK